MRNPMKTLIKSILFICSMLYFQVGHAQINYVLNGSFEQYSRCPDYLDQIRLANYWDAIDTNYTGWWPDTTFVNRQEQYPEYINSCATCCAASAPRNANFFQYPRTGKGMVRQVMMHDKSDTLFRNGSTNYLQGKLYDHLIAGQSYCVTFFVVQVNSNRISINKIGAYLDDRSIYLDYRPGAVYNRCTPQVVDTNIISDTLNWIKIQGSFTALGNERFITIGVFFDTGDISWDRSRYGRKYGMYLVDDVSVISSNANAYGGRDTLIRPGDTARLGAERNGDGMPSYWYVLGSSTPIDSGGTIYVTPTTTTTYVTRLDLCGRQSYDTVKVRVWPDTVVTVALGQLNDREVHIYPNPAATQITIDGAASCTLSLFDVVGTKVYEIAALSPRHTLDVSAMPKGLYFIHLYQPSTGERMVRKLRVE